MGSTISEGFNNEADYMKFLEYTYRFTRSKLRSEGIWSAVDCNERAHDIATDAIMAYSKKISRGEIVENRTAYVMMIIINRLRHPSFIKEKEAIKSKIVVANYLQEDVDRASYIKWQEDSDSTIEEVSQEYLWKVLAITSSSGVKFNEIELKIIELKDLGFNNREISQKINISEGYVSKLVKKIRTKINRNHWS